MTKTGVPWEASVPDQIAPVLRRYITEVRPALLARGQQNHDVLWVGKKGEVMSANYIGSRIGTLTLQLTGKRIPPHFFRDAAATTLARSSAQNARLIRSVLAHSGFQTAERHYIHAQTIDAGRDYASLLNRLKGAKS
jgi:site-specific recombinase XerD